MPNVYPMLDVGASPPEDERDSLEAMLLKYMQPGDDPYLKKAEEAKKRRDEIITAYKGTLAGGAQVGDQEPSKAERYFRLAQAFLNPGKTGHFYESMGNAAEVAGKIEEEKRIARRQQALDALKATSAGQKLDIDAASQDIDLYSNLAEREAINRGQIQRQMIESVTKPTEPASAAGKQAKDEGFTPGTPDFHKRVAQIAEASGDAQEARLNNALAQTALAQSRFERSGTEMSQTEARLLSETEDTLFSKQESKALLAQALALNPDTYDSSISDTLARFAAEGFAPDSLKVVNTRDLENILKTQLLTSLKATFGAAPTEGERAVLADLQGIDAKSRTERERIMKRAALLVDKRIEKDLNRLKSIREGQYRYRSTPTE